MRKISCNNSKRRWEELTNKFISYLKDDEYKNQQKIIELCHVAKMLNSLDAESYIEEISESPDFIINYQKRKVGIELKRLTDVSKKEYEGFWEKIFLNSENELRQENEIPNILVNCWLKSDIKYKIYQKRDYINIIKEVIQSYVSNKLVKKNPIIERIYTIPDSKISLRPNFGGYVQYHLSNNILQEFIIEKERRFLNEYRKNIEEVWLLIIISGVNESSYYIEESLPYQIQTNFDKVFLLEDFYDNLYQVK